MSPAASGSEPVIPADIRSQLPPEEVGAFDREWRQAMAEATEAFDLTPVSTMLGHWEKMAGSTEPDPEARRRALLMAAARSAGEDVPMRPWQEVKKELGL